MYAYRVRRDCLKFPVLRYTGGRWKFDRSSRHCMEFKMTEDKIARWNKMLLFFLLKIRTCTHLAWFLLSIWPISSFLGGFQVLVAAFYRRSQSWTLLFRKTCDPRGRYFTKIRIHCSIFPSNAKKDSPLVPFSGRLGKIVKLSAPIRTIFASLLALSTFRSTLLPSNILRHSFKSTLTTSPTWQMRLTRRVHSLERGL